MLFPVIVHKDAGTNYGIIVPDFPGVFSGGATLEEALENVNEALVLRFCDGEQCIVPRPSSLEAVIASSDAESGAIALVDLDPGAFGSQGQSMGQMNLPLALKRRIDCCANAKGISSAEYIENAINAYEGH